MVLDKWPLHARGSVSRIEEPRAIAPDVNPVVSSAFEEWPGFARLEVEHAPQKRLDVLAPLLAGAVTPHEGVREPEQRLVRGLPVFVP